MELSAKRVIGGGAWEVDDFDIGSGTRAQARTLDGKTADEVIGANTPSPQDSVKNMLKGFGL